jgi:hypothetical protein
VFVKEILLFYYLKQKCSPPPKIGADDQMGGGLFTTGVGLKSISCLIICFGYHS